MNYEGVLIMNENEGRSKFLSFIEDKATQVSQSANIAHWAGGLPPNKRNLALSAATWRDLTPHLEYIEQILNSL